MLNVLDFGAVGNNVADDTPAFLAAINALPSYGGTIFIPARNYSLVGPIDVHGKAVEFRGEGQGSDVEAPFGNAQWTQFPTTLIQGSVLRFKGPGVGGFVISPATPDPLPMCFRDLAIIGWGVGSGTGIHNQPTASSADHVFDNVLLANWTIGLDVSGSQDLIFTNLLVWGCGTGVSCILPNSQNLQFHNISIQVCGVGMDCNTSLTVVHGGIIQANGIGIRLKPVAPATVLEEMFFKGLWFELNTTNSILLDVSAAGVVGALMTTFEDCRCSDAGPNVVSLVTGAASSINNLRFANCAFAGAALTLPKNTGCTIDNSGFASITVADNTSVRLNQLDALNRFGGNKLTDVTLGLTGTRISNMTSFTWAWTPGNIPNGTSATTAQNVTTMSGDTVTCGLSVVVPAGVIVSPSIQQNGVGQVVVYNASGAAWNPGLMTVRLDVWKH